MEFLAIVLILLAVIAAEKYVYQKYAFSRLEYHCRFSAAEVFEGDEITLIEEVSNNKLLPLPWLKAELTTSKWLDFAGSQSLVTEETRFVPSFFLLKSHHRVVRSWKVKCLKRGVFHLEKGVLISTDLLGTCSVSLPVEIHAEVTVLPKPADMELGFRSVHSDSGPVIVRRHLLPDPFLIAGVREYVEGEPISHVHWLATARTGRLMVHNNEYSANQTLTVVLNVQSRSTEKYEVLDIDKIETGIRVCAGFLDDTLRSGIPVRLIANACPDGNGEPAVTGCFWGKEHILDCLRLLARMPLESSEHFPLFLRDVCSRFSSSDLVLVTAYLNEDIYDFAREQQLLGVRVKMIYLAHLLPDTVPSDLEIYQYWEEEADS